VNRRIPKSPTSTPEGLPRQRERELIAAAARVFRTGFPNSGRSGCPTQEALQSVSRKTRGSVESDAVLEHLTCCSPCFAEYERLLRSDRLSKNLKILALCASLLITVGLAVWFYSFRGEPGLRPPEPVIVQKEPPPQAPPTPFEVALVDLRNRSPVRGEQGPPPDGTVVASLPTRRLDLSVYLPIGSEAGRYEIQIVREAETPLVALNGSATLKDHNVVLRLRADLTGLDPGRYLLAVRKGNFRWTYYPIALKN
jgi:hypothetical protein